jgi:hypothetical protein
VTFEFRRVDVDRRELAIDVGLPFGVTVREELDCRPLGPDQCRVNYHCNFRFEDGWRGRAVRLLLRHELEAGPSDSLQRLKGAAERRFAASRLAV